MLTANQYHKFVVLSLFLCGFMFFGASCRGLAPEPTRERLQARVEGFIKARNQRDLEALRGFYENPADARVGNIRYVAGRIDKIELAKDGKKAEVGLVNSFKVMGFNFKDVKLKTHWQWNGKDWFIVVPEQSTPFGTQNHKSKESGHGKAQGK